MISCGAKTKKQATMKFIRRWVVAMMGSLLLVSPALTQSVLAELPDRENPKSWTRFTSHTDKFDVLMPAAPTLKQETILINRQQLLLTYYGTRRGQSDYAVLTLAGLRDANWHVAHMLLLDLYCRSSNSFKAIFQKIFLWTVMWEGNSVWKVTSVLENGASMNAIKLSLRSPAPVTRDPNNR